MLPRHERHGAFVRQRGVARRQDALHARRRLQRPPRDGDGPRGLQARPPRRAVRTRHGARRERRLRARRAGDDSAGAQDAERHQQGARAGRGAARVLIRSITGSSSSSARHGVAHGHGGGGWWQCEGGRGHRPLVPAGGALREQAAHRLALKRPSHAPRRPPGHRVPALRPREPARRSSRSCGRRAPLRPPPGGGRERGSAQAPRQRPPSCSAPASSASARVHEASAPPAQHRRGGVADGAQRPLPLEAAREAPSRGAEPGTRGAHHRLQPRRPAAPGEERNNGKAGDQVLPASPAIERVGRVRPRGGVGIAAVARLFTGDDEERQQGPDHSRTRVPERLQARIRRTFAEGAQEARRLGLRRHLPHVRHRHRLLRHPLVQSGEGENGGREEGDSPGGATGQEQGQVHVPSWQDDAPPRDSSCSGDWSRSLRDCLQKLLTIHEGAHHEAQAGSADDASGT
mmetsp:Transcript_11545/g.37906  ORF Transcript_11545/g.37906 Transcript_11545/m.37906 type:complete len:459 (-) Transcript_11545:3486-4862(-)